MIRRVRGVVVVAGLGVLIAGAFVLLPPRSAAAPQSASSSATAKVVAAAQAWLATLDDAGRGKAQMAYDAPEKRTKWSNFPITMVPRNGVRLGDLNPKQREAAMAVLAAAFSSDGYRKVVEIVRGDEILKANPGPGPGGGPRPSGAGGPPPSSPGGPGRGPGRLMFGQDEYFLAFAGTPSTTAPWMLQFGGHHLSLIHI